MKNDDEMYQSILSRWNEHQEKKKKRIRTIRRTVPVLAYFCFVVIFGLGYWDNLENLPNIQIQPDVVDEGAIKNSESTTDADTTESRSADQDISADAVSTTIMPQNSTTDIAAVKRIPQRQTVTAAVSNEESDRKTEQGTIGHKETQAPVTTAPNAEPKPIIDVQTTSPVQTTAEAPKTIVTETEPIKDDGIVNDCKLLYPIGKQIDFDSYKAMAASSYLIYNDIGASTTTSKETTTSQTTAPVQSETTTTTVNIDDQQTALEKLIKKEKRLFGEFRRERAIILGELSPDAKRLTLDEVNKIIKDSNSYNEICGKLNAAQPYADYFGGSGVSLVEYWFDDKGTQKITLILEQKDIFYIHFKEGDKIYY